MTIKLGYTKQIFFILLAGMTMILSCSKKDFLDKKPSSDLVVPTTLEDFQTLLDNNDVMSQTPELGELSADNFYLDYGFWQGLSAEERNAYVWAKDIYEGEGNIDDWNIPYQQVFYANVVLDGLPGVAIDSSNRQQWNALEGAAYFIRAYAFYNIAQVFAPVYNSATATTDLGIPLRLSSDINPVSTRLPLKATYDQILSDLQQASSLLPWAIPFANLNRPSKPAALAMLARVYLSMGGYGQAGVYADSCLQAYSQLLDFNTLTGDTGLNRSFPYPNAEILYDTHILSNSGVLLGLFYPSCVVDSDLYRSYAADDLRRSLFYRMNATGRPILKGSYSYNDGFAPFSGLATDEMYLVRAECSARAGNTDIAMGDLNALLKKRWITADFTPDSAMNSAQALSLILTERRKELAFRGLRWTDLRRLNKENADILLIRVLNGISYDLPAASENYVLPIPPDVITLSGIAQNPRQ